MGLADRAGRASLHVATFRRLEATIDPHGNAVSLVSVANAVEDTGVDFIPADETKGPGVRLKQVPEPPRRVRTKRSGS